MEFLVHVRVAPPADMKDDEIKRLFDAEGARAAELFATGGLRRLWRIPGAWANWGLWEAADATELHAMLSSLPLWRWLEIEVHPLAGHPFDRQASGAT